MFGLRGDYRATSNPQKRLPKEPFTIFHHSYIESVATTILLKQLQNLLWQLVRLGEHRHTRLLKDLVLRKIGGFLCKIRILNSRTGTRKIFYIILQILYRCLKTIL